MINIKTLCEIKNKEVYIKNRILPYLFKKILNSKEAAIEFVS